MANVEEHFSHPLLKRQHDSKEGGQPSKHTELSFAAGWKDN